MGEVGEVKKMKEIEWLGSGSGSTDDGDGGDGKRTDSEGVIVIDDDDGSVRLEWGPEMMMVSCYFGSGHRESPS